MIVIVVHGFQIGDRILIIRNQYQQKKSWGGVLLELSHDLDIVNNFFGPITIDHCSKFNTNLLDIDVEDYALIHGRSNFMIQYQ